MTRPDRLADLAALLADVAEAEDRAAQAFGAALEIAAGEVAVRWADPLPTAAGPGGRPIAHLPVFDARYPAARASAPAPGWRGAWFEWSFGISELREERPGQVAFAAGAGAPLGTGGPLADPAWLERRRAEGFEQLRNARLGADQVLRWLDVDAVLAAGEPVDQGDRIADWVVATFELLAGDPPAATGRPSGP
jgi:hypothetical protein